MMSQLIWRSGARPGLDSDIASIVHDHGASATTPGSDLMPEPAPSRPERPAWPAPRRRTMAMALPPARPLLAAGLTKQADGLSGGDNAAAMPTFLMRR